MEFISLSVGKCQPMDHPRLNRIMSTSICGRSLENHIIVLNVVDADGFSERFSVERVEFDSRKSFHVYPNPSPDGKVIIDLSFTPTEIVCISFTDVMGIEKTTLTTTENHLKFDLSSGIYLIKISSGMWSSVERVVVK